MERAFKLYPACARSEIDVENGHREIIRQFAFILILVDKAEKFVGEVKLGGIILARTRLHLKIRIVEGPFEIGVQFFEFFGFQPDSPDIDLKPVYCTRHFLM